MAIITTQFATQTAATDAIDSAAGALSLDTAFNVFDDFTNSDLGTAVFDPGPSQSPIHVSGTFTGGALFDLRGGNLQGSTGTATVLRLEYENAGATLVATTGAPGAAGGLSIVKSTGAVSGSILAFDYLDPNVHIAFSGSASASTGAVTVKSVLYDDIADDITIQVGSTGGFTLNAAGTVTGGTITSASLTVGGVTMSASGLAVSALAFFGNGTTILPTPDQQYALIFSGNDSITAYADGQELAGGKGNDTYDIGTHTGVLITEEAIVGGGIDVVRSEDSYLLDANVEKGVLTGTGDSSMTGNSGNNTLTGNAGNNTLDGAAGNDNMAGGAGNDYFVVDAAGDVVVESIAGGNDTVESHAASITLAANVEVLVLGLGAVNGTGNALNNTITGNAGSDKLDGGGGNDSIDGIAGGLDTLLGGAGNDTLASYNSTDSLDGGAGIDKVILNVGGGTFTLGTMTENLDLHGGVGVTAVGNSLANVFSSLALINDTLDGSGGNDTYELQAGDQADETLAGAAGGTDLVIADDDFTLGTNIERLTLDTTGHTGTGNGLANVLTSVGGTNTLIGGAGNDSFNVHASDVAQEQDTTTGGGTADQVNATLGDGEQFILSDGLERLVLVHDGLPGPGFITGTGNTAANSIYGAAAADNSLSGGDGNDALVGGAGNDTLDGGNGTDAMSGGAGNDLYILDIANTLGKMETPETLQLFDTGGSADTLKVIGGGAINAGTLILNVSSFPTENVDASGADAAVTVQIIGGAANNWFVGTGNANDTLVGGAGNDTLDGGAGSDRLEGGAGNDYYVWDGTDSIVDSGGIDTVEFSDDSDHNVFDVPNTEGVVLNSTMAGTATGDGNANFLGSLNGDHTLVGAAGNDTYSVQFLAALEKDDVQEDDALTGNGHRDLIIATLANGFFWNMLDDGNVEDITLRAAVAGTTVNVIGNALNNLMTGANDANNNMDGGAGADTLIGGAGNDTLYGNAGGLADVLTGGLGNDQFIIDLKNSIVGALEDTFSDTGGIDTLVVQGNATVAGFNHTMAGAIENIDLEDTLLIDLKITGNALANNIEGNAGVNTLDGAAGNDTIDACDGNDSVLGGAGNDSLEGGPDDDTLDGGLGNDTYSENFGDDSFVIAQAGDTISVIEDSGIDTVRVALVGNSYLDLRGGNDFLENVVFTGTLSVILTGNDKDNQLTGAAGNDSISGGIGADTLSGAAGADTLDGGTGVDNMGGGAGNDRYLVDEVTDNVVESMAGGTDTVIASVDNYALAANVENLILAGAVASGTGNAGANSITGNAEANSLSGGGGNDVLTGGEGNDSFVLEFITANNVTRITDFEQGSDQLYGGGLLSTLFNNGNLVDGVNLINANAIPATVANAGETLIYVASTGSLYYDPNGGTTTDKVLIATFDLAHRPYAVSDSDFYTT